MSSFTYHEKEGSWEAKKLRRLEKQCPSGK